MLPHSYEQPAAILLILGGTLTGVIICVLAGLLSSGCNIAYHIAGNIARQVAIALGVAVTALPVAVVVLVQESGETRQVVVPDIDDAPGFLDLADEDDPEVAAARWMTERTNRPIDPFRDRLAGTTLIHASVEDIPQTTRSHSSFFSASASTRLVASASEPCNASSTSCNEILRPLRLTISLMRPVMYR